MMFNVDISHMCTNLHYWFVHQNIWGGGGGGGGGGWQMLVWAGGTTYIISKPVQVSYAFHYTTSLFIGMIYCRSGRR